MIELLAPEPFAAPLVPPTSEDERLVSLIEQHEAAFIAADNPEQREKIQRHITALETKLSHDTLRRHNDMLRAQLAQNQSELVELRDQFAELRDAIRAAT